MLLKAKISVDRQKRFAPIVNSGSPLNPPFWGTLNRKFWLEVPQNGGFRGQKPLTTK